MFLSYVPTGLEYSPPTACGWIYANTNALRFSVRDQIVQGQLWTTNICFFKIKFVFIPRILMVCKLSKYVCTLSRDKHHYVQFLLLFPEHNSDSQPCEKVTIRVSHFPVKSHPLALSLLRSSLGSQPFLTLYPYLS